MRGLDARLIGDAKRVGSFTQSKKISQEEIPLTQVCNLKLQAGDIFI